MIVHHIIRAEGELAEWFQRQNNTEHLYSDIRRALLNIQSGQRDMAKSIHDINASVTDLRAAIAAEKEEAREILDTMQTSIDELKELVAAGGTQEQIQESLDNVQSAKDEVMGIVTKEAPPPTGEEGEGEGDGA